MDDWGIAANPAAAGATNVSVRRSPRAGVRELSKAVQLVTPRWPKRSQRRVAAGTVLCPEALPTLGPTLALGQGPRPWLVNGELEDRRDVGIEDGFGDGCCAERPEHGAELLP